MILESQTTKYRVRSKSFTHVSIYKHTDLLGGVHQLFGVDIPDKGSALAFRLSSGPKTANILVFGIREWFDNAITVTPEYFVGDTPPDIEAPGPRDSGAYWWDTSSGKVHLFKQLVTLSGCVYSWEALDVDRAVRCVVDPTTKRIVRVLLTLNQLPLYGIKLDSTASGHVEYTYDDLMRDIDHL